MKFVSLHHHTTFSFLDGYGSPAKHAERAAELGYTALSATEHGNVSSHFQHEKACIKAGIKPVFGIEAYTASSYGEPRQSKYHLTVLAKDQVGYRNLNKLVTLSWQQYYYHPTMKGSDIAEFGEGLIILSGCSGSFMACNLIGGKGFKEPESKDERDTAWESTFLIAENFKKLFPGRFYLEVQAFPELESTQKINRAYSYLSRELDIPLAATMDVHYPRPEDNKMQVILHACGPQGRGQASADEMLRRWNYDVLLTLPDTDRLLSKRLKDTGLRREQAWEAIETTAEIANQCNVTLPKAERLRYPIADEDWDPWT